jgi:phosphatidylserine decarboxylase
LLIMPASCAKRWGLIAAPGYNFILASAVLVFLGLIGHWPWLTVLGLAAGGFFIYFFRDPERPIPQENGAIISPADGKVVLVDEIPAGQYYPGPARRVAIFMNVFDVHVNRSPVAGTVKAIVHQPGRYKAAFYKDASEQNERQLTLLRSNQGYPVLVVQIAGLLARRIIGWVQPDQALGRGERLGMICFGSRVDLYLPLNTAIQVKVGDRVKAGSSIVGRWA